MACSQVGSSAPGYTHDIYVNGVGFFFRLIVRSSNHLPYGDRVDAQNFSGSECSHGIYPECAESAIRRLMSMINEKCVIEKMVDTGGKYGESILGSLLLDQRAFQY